MYLNNKFNAEIYLNHDNYHIVIGGRRGRDCMVVGLTTTNASSAYYHLSCEFESAHGDVYSIQYHVIKFVSDRSVVFSGYSGFPHK